MLSAETLAAVRIGIVCTSPKHTPTTNIRAVVDFVMAVPVVSLRVGTTNTMAPSSR